MLLITDVNMEVGKSIPTPESRDPGHRMQRLPFAGFKTIYTRLLQLYYGRQLNSVLPILPTV